MMTLSRGSLFACLFAMGLATTVDGADWSRFRGPNGSGISEEDKSLPVTWSDTKNLKWRAEMPGPGSSCPIVVGDRVFATAWSGYADGDGAQGSMENLKRHLVCIDRKTGKKLWDVAEKAKLPEDSYRGMFAENGYATHTPVSDGELVYTFYGKSGVHAYDMKGEKVWDANVGEDRDRRGWGSASSPLIHENLLIVPAAIENHAIVALDKKTGKEVWKQEAEGFGATWGSPILVKGKDRTELVIGVPYEIWSLNAANGKLLWYSEAIGSNSMCSSVVENDGVIYAIESGPGGGGAVAVKAGGKGDVSKSHVVWQTRDRSRVGTPIAHKDRLYWVSSGVANCVNATNGERIYQKRLQSNRSSDDDDRGGRGRRGGRGGQDYSSPILADGKIYYARRSGEVYVVKVGDEFEQLAVNRFDSSEGDYHATPAVSDGELFIRSSRTIYCVAKDKE